MGNRLTKIYTKKGNKKLSKEKFKQRMKMVQDELVLKEQTLERVLLELNEHVSVLQILVWMILK